LPARRHERSLYQRANGYNYVKVFGDWPAVRWIFDFKHLARTALDPLPADQHERFLKRCRVTARYV
jgi:hypothetical protein